MIPNDKSCPCYGCSKRHIGCHGSCDDYKKWTIHNEKIKAIEKRERQGMYINYDSNRTRF